MNVDQVMTPGPQYLPPSASINEAAAIMESLDVGSVPIVEEGQLVGIITDRDIVVKGLASGADPQNHRVSDIMTQDIHVINPDDDVERAFQEMEDAQVRRLPVVDAQGSLVGIVSLGDLATRAQDPSKAGEALEGVSEHIH